MLWGYTVHDLNHLAGQVVWINRHWWPMGDRGDQHDTAWMGIVEYLCSATEAPARRDLLQAGTAALAAEVKARMRHHGTRRDGLGTGGRFAAYWFWYGRAVPGPEETVVDRVALGQVLDTLTPGQRDAITALAVTDDHGRAGALLGKNRAAYQALLSTGRRRFDAWWYEGETPPRRRPDRRVARYETSDPQELAARARYAARKRVERAAA